ncbi:MAG: BMP family protein [Thermoanaerobaculia bacterium]
MSSRPLRAPRGIETSAAVQNTRKGRDHARLFLSSLFCVPLLLLTFIGCSRGETPVPAERPDAFEVGLLTTGSINDAGWNALGYEGLRRIREELEAEVTHLETNSAAEHPESFRTLGRKGFDLVFGHGYEFQSATLDAAARYPKTQFITTSGSRIGSNVSPLVFETEETAYLLGMLAAMESRTGKAGVIGAVQLPPIASTFLAFRKGARSIDPDFEVREVYTGIASDEETRLAALALADEGCDVLMHQLSAQGPAVVEACRERDLRCFGTSRGQNDLAPEVMVASAVVDVPVAFVAIGRLVKSGKFEPKIYSFGLKDGIVTLAWNERHRLALAPEKMKLLDETETEMREGRFVMPAGGF